MQLLCAGDAVPEPSCAEQCSAQWLRRSCRRMRAQHSAMIAQLPGARATAIPPEHCLSIRFNTDNEAAAHTVIAVPPEAAAFVLELLAMHHREHCPPSSATATDVDSDDDDDCDDSCA